jgi:SAM-dependent methyltransferase
MAESSHERYKVRYLNPQKAARYAGKQNATRTHRLEVACIERALCNEHIDTVLDLPCGAGRLVPDLVGMGYKVTAGDVAPPMVDEARRFLGDLPGVDFVVADVMQTGFVDGRFDAVICNRLFHHFSEPEVRVAALKELGRIASKCVVVSFFCSLSVDAVTFHLANLLRGRSSTDRIPILLSTMKKDVHAAGLRISGVYPMRPGISRQWYLRLVAGQI